MSKKKYEQRVQKRAEEFAKSCSGFNDLSKRGQEDQIEDLKKIAIIAVHREAKAYRIAMLRHWVSDLDNDSKAEIINRELQERGLIP